MNRSQRTSDDPIPVVIVGAGPVGVTAATLLGQYGVDCLVLDRWDGVYPQPRAVHLDDEIYRVLVRLGIAEQFAAVSRPTRLGDRCTTRTAGPTARSRMSTGFSSVIPVVHTPYGLRRKV